MSNHVRARPKTGGATGRRTPLEHDAAALYDAMTALIRIYQFRDRDRVGYYGLTITQCYVLQLLLRRGAMTLNELAAEMHVDKSVLSRVVDGLENKRAITRAANPADGRSMLITATNAGTQRYLRAETDVVAEYSTILSAFPLSVRKQLIKLIGALTSALEVRKMTPADEAPA